MDEAALEPGSSQDMITAGPEATKAAVAGASALTWETGKAFLGSHT